MSAPTVVVGGGLSGLTAAHALRRAGVDVLLIESSGRAGGVVRTEMRDGFLLEGGPNTVRPSPQLWSLIEELGLSGEVLLADPRAPRYIDFAGELRALPMSPMSFAGTRLLSVLAKLRLLFEPLRSRGTDPDESVRDFVLRRLGVEVADRLVEPFVGGIFAGSAARLSVSSAFPTLARWEREHGSLLAGALADRRTNSSSAPARKGLVSFRKGLETLPRALARALGAAWRPGTEAEAIAPEGPVWRIVTRGETLKAGRVILAVPAHRASALVAPIAPEAARALAAIPHPPLAVLHMAWPEGSLLRSLRGFGHLVVPDPRRRILGAVWSSSLFAGRAPAGWVLLTVFLGGMRDPHALELSDEELAAAAARDLEAERIVRGQPRMVMLTRWPRAIPQYERGHAGCMDVLAQAEARWPGLQFLGNYRGGVSVADVIRSGLAAGTYK